MLLSHHWNLPLILIYYLLFFLLFANKSITILMEWIILQKEYLRSEYDSFLDLLIMIQSTASCHCYRAPADALLILNLLTSDLVSKYEHWFQSWVFLHSPHRPTKRKILWFQVILTENFFLFLTLKVLLDYQI